MEKKKEIVVLAQITVLRLKGCRRKEESNDENKTGRRNYG
jgi:uncharacterized lipoprotein YehR (DUF1307 family)